MATCDMPCTYSVDSSAYRLILLSSRYFSKLFISIINDIGPGIEPCGTSHVIDRNSDLTPIALTACFGELDHF